MGLPLIMAVASLGMQGGSILQSHKAKKIAKSAAQVERAMQARELADRKIEIAERARAYVAQAANAAEQLGAGGSSAVLGQSGAIVSAGAGNVREYNETFSANEQLGRLEEEQQDALFNGQVLQFAGSVLGKVAEITGGFGDLAKVFGYEGGGSPGVDSPDAVFSPGSDYQKAWQEVDLSLPWETK